MERLIELARNLGRNIAEHERFLEFQKARQTVNDDPDAAELIKSYQDQAARIQKRESENQPIEVDDKHKLRELEAQIASHPILAELTRRQADYIELMRKVNRALEEQLQSAEK